MTNHLSPQVEAALVALHALVDGHVKAALATDAMRAFDPDAGHVAAC